MSSVLEYVVDHEGGEATVDGHVGRLHHVHDSLEQHFVEGTQVLLRMGGGQLPQSGDHSEAQEIVLLVQALHAPKLLHAPRLR